VAAARRIAKRVAALDTGDPEPGPIALRAALREVVGRCIYGVDVNPLAAELAKVSLWLETLEPGTPLAFLDAHIKVGNSLLGATPALIAGGIPSDAFKPITGDDRKVAASPIKRNTAERAGQAGIFDEDGVHVGNRELAAAVTSADAPTASLVDVHRTAARYGEALDSPAFRRARGVADAWCAAFLWRKAPQGAPPITHRVLPQFDKRGLPGVDRATIAEVDRLAGSYGFFHWHVEFPEVFAVPDAPSAEESTPGWTGGFSCVLTNPPWERLKIQEQEFFAALDRMSPPRLTPQSGGDGSLRSRSTTQSCTRRSPRPNGGLKGRATGCEPRGATRSPDGVTSTPTRCSPRRHAHSSVRAVGWASSSRRALPRTPRPSTSSATSSSRPRSRRCTTSKIFVHCSRTWTVGSSSRYSH